ncbi:hypothetical protein B0T11DRAFT_75767 [Plectosphaerella cucumerina]|uniref:Uncharacterized protein n=1 Tax=Plectosphaerella cucumerina TaxID=40658 RepID=A0A8K0X2E3_9PEZI|nr:hypothetical protein B0T11DRAFT_75767 [Plectosphaerella cucumerina]
MTLANTPDPGAWRSRTSGVSSRRACSVLTSCPSALPHLHCCTSDRLPWRNQTTIDHFCRVSHNSKRLTKHPENACDACASDRPDFSPCATGPHRRRRPSPPTHGPFTSTWHPRPSILPAGTESRAASSGSMSARGSLLKLNPRDARPHSRFCPCVDHTTRGGETCLPRYLGLVHPSQGTKRFLTPPSTKCRSCTWPIS